LQRTVRMIPTGCGSLDKLLCGGISTSDITLVYGEAETGKTCLAIQCAVNAGRLGCKTIFIDSEGAFSTKRLSQIAHHDLNEVSPMITLVKPSTFQEQALVIDRLEEYLTSTVGLVIFDTVTSLYRAEMSEKKEKTFELNRELGRQLACLAQIVKTKKVAVLITSQVHSTFIEGSGEIEPVATRVLRFWSDTVINLKPTSQRNAVKAVLEKHSKRKCPADCYLSIEEVGICDYGR
jgi:DNA repair and recombination protein RadB